MTTPVHDRVLRVADLVDRPGTSRRVDLALPAPADLALELAEVVGPVRLVGVVESVVEGVLVRVLLEATVRTPCARCLRDLVTPVDAEVVELFTDPADAELADDVDPGYEIVEGIIDLDALLRDALVPAVPYRPLCREDCAGLCPQCGVERDAAACDCTDTTTDARWAALQGLRLRDDG